MNISKYNCVICHLPFDDSIHLPRILNKCGHTVCSLCISKNFLSNENNTFNCPKDSTIYSNIDNINYFEINKEMLDKIKEIKNDNTKNNVNLNDSSKFDNIYSEKISIRTKTTKTKIDTVNDNSLFNNTLISSANNNQNNHHCYIKKIIKFGKKFKFSKNSLICSIHSLPLNIICVNDQQKICSQCALNNIHLNHQIIPENKFIEYVDELVKVYQEIESNLNIYGDIYNINSSLILEKIEKKMNKYKNNVSKVCEELIDTINNQRKQIEKFLDLRKNEIINKYQFTNYDINNLRETTNKWINLTIGKLTQANSGNFEDFNIECLKLLDNDKDKNIFSLINLGKQLNERYNFINETKDIIDNLNEFYKKGINIETNYNIVDSIMANTFINEGIKDTKIYNNYNYNESIINTKGNNISTLENNGSNRSINLNYKLNNKNVFETSLFKIEENKDIIDSLHLTSISFLYKQTKNIFITYENDDFDNNEPFNTVCNISNLFPPKFKLFNNDISKKNNIYSKKTVNPNNNYNTYKNEYYISFKNQNMSKSQSNFYNISSKMNILDLKENQISKHNRFAQTGNIGYKTLYNLGDYKNNNIAQTFKRILYPKLEKEKTSDIIFLGVNKNKNNKDSLVLTDKRGIKYKHENTSHKLPMSPKLKTVYNIISNNMKMNNIYSPQIEYKNKNINNKSNEIKNEKKNTIKNRDDKYKTKYVRCVSCSSSLNKKDIQDISILFNLKDKDEVSTENNSKPNVLNKNKKVNKIKDKNKDKDKDSDISDNINNINNINNNNSKNNQNLNRSCIKTNSKTIYNFRNKNNKSQSQSKNINSSIINKNSNELLKLIHNQMKKNNPVFNRINMRGKGTELLCNYMQNNQKKKYKEIKMPGCNLNDNDFCLLVRSLIENEIEAPILNLSYNKITDNSAKYIFEIIKKKSGLKNIYLHNNIFSKNFVETIKNYNKDNDVDYIKFYT